MNSENKIYDVVIGGQGAAAFAAGMYAARYQMSAIVCLLYTSPSPRDRG